MDKSKIMVGLLVVLTAIAAFLIGNYLGGSDTFVLMQERGENTEKQDDENTNQLTDDNSQDNNLVISPVSDLSVTKSIEILGGTLAYPALWSGYSTIDFESPDSFTGFLAINEESITIITPSGGPMYLLSASITEVSLENSAKKKYDDAEITKYDDSMDFAYIKKEIKSLGGRTVYVLQSESSVYGGYTEFLFEDSGPNGEKFLYSFGSPNEYYDKYTEEVESIIGSFTKR